MQVSHSKPDEKTEIIGGDGTVTQPLPQLPPFAPLPEGALINNGQYEYRITQLRQESGEQNDYSAVATTNVQTCSNCGFFLNPERQERCTHCRHDLSNVSPHRLHVRVRETSRPDRFAAETHLAGLGIAAPHLRVPLDAIRRRVGGQERHYLVLPPPPAEWLPALEPPCELPKVLDWGVSLAQALAALHENQVAFGPFGKERVGLEAGRASLADFSQSYYPGRDKLYTQDIRQLAGLLYYLLTGQTRFDERATLPASVQAIFSRALAGEPGYPTAAAFGSALDEALSEIRRPPGVDFVVGRRTDVGMERQLNEDSLLTLNLVMNNQSINQPLGVFAVADGMGGHAAGEIASGLALRAVAHSAVHELLTLDAEGELSLAHARWIEKAVAAANTAVHQEMRQTKRDLGTTLVMALIRGDNVYLANVGDSRAYLISDQEIRQLTVDHSLVQRLITSGQITQEEARYHPQRNVIYRTIGDKETIEPDHWQLRLKPGECLLLCSDGLSGMLEDQTIHRLIREANSPQQACEHLVRAANEAGGTDNITAVLIQLRAVDG